HVHVIPVVDAGTDNHHGAAVGLLGVGGEFTGHLDNGLTGHAGDFFSPGGGEGHVVIVALGHVLAAKPPVNAVVGEKQVVGGGHIGLARDQLQFLYRNVTQQDRLVVGGDKVFWRHVAEVRKGHGNHRV